MAKTNNYGTLQVVCKVRILLSNLKDGEIVWRMLQYSIQNLMIIYLCLGYLMVMEVRIRFKYILMLGPEAAKFAGKYF